jgi:uncharacterized membrane protein (UPF0127 family)
VRPLLLALLTIGLSTLPAAGRAQQEAVGQCGDPLAPYAEVQIDTYPRVDLEVARTPEEHQIGLMFREWMPPDSGMVFVYDRPAVEGYWMHNTLLPLSIAWIGREGSIVDIQDMQPQTDDVHFPSGAYWYALEVNQGWFTDHGVGVGQQVIFCLGTPA